MFVFFQRIDKVERVGKLDDGIPSTTCMYRRYEKLQRTCIGIRTCGFLQEKEDRLYFQGKENRLYGLFWGTWNAKEKLDENQLAVVE